jgi:hypothetical protein
MRAEKRRRVEGPSCSVASYWSSICVCQAFNLQNCGALQDPGHMFNVPLCSLWILLKCLIVPLHTCGVRLQGGVRSSLPASLCAEGQIGSAPCCQPWLCLGLHDVELENQSMYLATFLQHRMGGAPQLLLPTCPLCSWDGSIPYGSKASCCSRTQSSCRTPELLMAWVRG